MADKKSPIPENGEFGQGYRDTRSPERRIEDIKAVADVSRRVEEQVVGQSRGYFLPFTEVEHTAHGGGYHSGNDVLFRTPVVRTMRMKRFVLAVYVHTTNNGTHYWQFTLRTNVTGTVKVLDTSALSANTWSRLEATTFVVNVIDTTDIMIEIYAEEVGNPGDVEVSPALYVL